MAWSKIETVSKMMKSYFQTVSGGNLIETVSGRQKTRIVSLGNCVRFLPKGFFPKLSLFKNSLYFGAGVVTAGGYSSIYVERFQNKTWGTWVDVLLFFCYFFTACNSCSLIKILSFPGWTVKYFSRVWVFAVTRKDFATENIVKIEIITPCSSSSFLLFSIFVWSTEPGFLTSN